MKKISHLDDKQIIEAVIDERGLDEALRRHLFECSDCRAQKEALKGRLALFGQVSRGQAPADFRKPRIIEKRARAYRPAWKIRPALGLGVVFATIFALLLSPMTIKRDKLFTQDVVYREMAQDEKFMSEIEQLEENPLPRFYVDMGDQSDDEGDVQPPGADSNDGPALDGGSRNA